MEPLESLLSTPYALPIEVKHERLLAELLEQTRRWSEQCPPYRRILRGIGFSWDRVHGLEDLPLLPIELLRRLDLGDVVPPAPTGLTSVVAALLGPVRPPMIVCDAASALKGRGAGTPRGQEIRALAALGSDHLYALDDSLSLRVDDLLRFVQLHAGEPLAIFGNTAMVWEHLMEPLHEKGVRLPHHGGLLLHSGCWKRLVDRAVSNEQYKDAARQVLGVSRVHNLYGIAEQGGGVFAECECGHFHAPAFAEVLTRDYRRWSILPPRVEGVIQTLSVVPQTFPGHSLLTDHLGVILGQDDCPCGRLGTYFRVLAPWSGM